MSFEKYYDHIIENDVVNNSYVTFLATNHIINVLTRRDKNTDAMLPDLGINYVHKYRQSIEGVNYPLGFLYDHIFAMYSFTKPHLDRILKNPKTSIIKESKFVSANKIKNIEPKTMVWLADKPGTTFREKIALAGKVSTTIKRYSNNVQANQVVLAFYKRLRKLLLKKIEVMKSNPELFGNIEEYDETKKLLTEIRKVDYILKNEFAEVPYKDISKANNTLLGNTDYRCIWNTYVDLKHGLSEFENVLDDYKQILFRVFVINLLEKYHFIEKAVDLDEIYSYVIYSAANNTISCLSFEIDDAIVIKRTESIIDGGKLVIQNEEKFKFSITKSEEQALSNRGIEYSLNYNDNTAGSYYADLSGMNDTIKRMTELIKLEFIPRRDKDEHRLKTDFISINAFDNSIYGISENEVIEATIGKKEIQIEHPIVVCDRVKFLASEIYYADGDNLYLSQKDNKEYLSLLNKVSDKSLLDGNFSIIYDINDTFDEFSSMELRKCFSSAFPKTYPVWRSILCGEAWKRLYADEGTGIIEHIVDLCGSDFSVSKLGTKNNRFIHYGAQEIPIHVARHKFNEKDIINEYLLDYQKKYDVSFPNELINDFIYSGKITRMFKDKERIFSCLGKDNVFYCLVYDNEIFDSVLKKFRQKLEWLSMYYNNACFIVPDYINIDSELLLHNRELLLGAEEIRNRLDRREISWYEFLPDLSLEIIRNGMYDEFPLVRGFECENIIGKKISITPQEKYTLKKGKQNYILPLNKSFVGEKSHFFVAKIEDDSFPLNKDVDVRLHVEYAFASENSYRLFIKPADTKEPPFSIIEAVWEEEVTSGEIIDLSIDDVVYDEEQINSVLNERIPRSLYFFSKHVLAIQNKQYVIKTSDGKKTEVMKKIVSGVAKLINDAQRLSHYSDNTRDQVDNMLLEQQVASKLEYILKNVKKEADSDMGNDKRKNIVEFRISELEEAIVAVSLDRNMFIEKTLRYPETCFGRYFAEIQDDKEIIEIAYNKLIELSTTPNYLEDKPIRRYLQKLTSATAVNHLSIKNIVDVNPAYGLYLLNVCVQILKEMSKYDWNQDAEGYINTPKENAYLIRSCVELIIALLFCRESIAFNDLRPGGATARKIILYLKKINRNYYKAMSNWPEDEKKPRMDTKYHLKVDLPSDLNNMWMEAYCLILCLSGDKRTNLITAGD